MRDENAISDAKFNIEAQFKQGLRYEQGRGVKKNLKSALADYRRVISQVDQILKEKGKAKALQGSSDYKDLKDLKDLKAKALMRLGNYYTQKELPLPMSKDGGKEVTAFNRFRIAAEAGHPPALYPLGLCYKSGYGVKKDEEKAKELIKRAAGLGDIRAQAEVELNRCRFLGASSGTPRHDDNDCDRDDQAELRPKDFPSVHYSKS